MQVKSFGHRRQAGSFAFAHAAVFHDVAAVAAPLHPAALELLVVQRRVQPAVPEQVPVRPRLDHLSAVDDVDHVGVDDGGQPVRDRDRGPRPHQRVECLLHLALAGRVQRRGRLVQDQDARVVQQHPGDGAQVPHDVLPDHGRLVGLQDPDGAVDDRDERHDADQDVQQLQVGTARDEQRLVEHRPDEQRVDDADRRGQHDQADHGRHPAAVRPEQRYHPPRGVPSHPSTIAPARRPVIGPGAGRASSRPTAPRSSRPRSGRPRWRRARPAGPSAAVRARGRCWCRAGSTGS